MEFWDVLNKFGNPTGKIVKKGDKLEENEFHLSVHVWIINSHNKILIQQRQSNRTFAPDMWAVHGGKVISGETSMQASIRELKEEIGICINPDNLKGPTRYKRKSSNEFCDIYVLKQDVDLKDIKLQKEEVKDIKWVTKTELQQMIKEKSFYRYSDEYFKCLSKYLNLLL
ncbi:NUDIX domain-containing protein [Clostridium neuense]|uniref:NUDIX domain-containing protein n=1 Tax=Clostridium neuense TaxID=1728934 RepID=A0ABW8TK31_9CLOT